MLIEFRVANFRSIAEEQSLSMVASRRIKDLQENTFTAPGLEGISLLESAVVYGGNGAGKSNLLRALGILRHMVVYSAFDLPSGTIPVEPFALDDDFAKTATLFDIAFLVSGVRYQYIVAATTKNVELEKLVAYPEGRPQVWFERTSSNGKDAWYFGPKLKGDKKTLAQATKETSLFLSVAASLNHEQLSHVYKYFASKIVVLAAGLPSVAGASLRSTESEAHKDPKFRKRVEGYLRDADVGITGFEIEHKKMEPIQLQLPDGQGVASVERPPVLQVRTHHKTRSGKVERFRLAQESDGTRSLFRIIGPWIEALETGCVLAVDEAFANLHPAITRKLIEELHRQSTSERPAQLLFTTHDTSVLDRELFRRDQIFFVEKDRSSSTRIYSLQEFKPRRDEALGRNYLLGRYGAVPFLGSFKH